MPDAVRSLCCLYAWLKQPLGRRSHEDTRQTKLIRQAWADSGKVYVYRRLTEDLRDPGERISENRVARMEPLAGGFKRWPGRYAGKPAIVAKKWLGQPFHSSRPDQIWVTEITRLRTNAGWLHLAIVIDPFSRSVVGWSAKSRMTTIIALQSLLMAVWRRKPCSKVKVHSDQGSLFTSREW